LVSADGSDGVSQVFSKNGQVAKTSIFVAHTRGW